MAEPALTRPDSSRSIYAPGGDPLRYPGEIPASPHLFLGSKAVPIEWDDPRREPTLVGSDQTVSEILARRGSAPFRERVPQIAFGANRDPDNLLWKFQNERAPGEDPISPDTIAIPATLPDADVVACNLGYWGYIYGALIFHRPPTLQRPYLAGSRVPVLLLFLEPDQIRAMHRSEGVPLVIGAPRPAVSCDVALLNVDLPNGATLRAQMYALSLPYLSFDGARPVPFAAVRTLGRSPELEAMDQRALFERIAAALDLPGGDSGAPGVAAALAIREGVLERDPPGEGSRLFDAIRRGILEKLTLRDPDGVIRKGSDSLPGLLPPERAWDFWPTVGEQL